jgi:hypothetical protein
MLRQSYRLTLGMDPLGPKLSCSLLGLGSGESLVIKKTKETTAFVGSLVGATMEVDEPSLMRANYVRIRIAARDVSRIPTVAEGAIIP